MKKMTYTALLALTVCMALLLSACGGTVSQNETETTTTAQTTQASVTETTTTQVTEDTATETTESTEDTTEPTEAESEESDIIGSGTEDDPYLQTPDLETMTVETVSIPAGGSVFYGIYRTGKMTFTIDNAAAYVVCEGDRYDAENGTVEFIGPNILASDAVLFEIGNSGDADAVFTIHFANQKGSQMDPEVITALADDHSVSLAEEQSSGYYYQYIAEKSGMIRFFMEASVDSMMYVTNNRNSAQRSTEGDALTDANGNTYIEIEAQEGDEIIVNVAAKPNRRGNYPATDITWNGLYE